MNLTKNELKTAMTKKYIGRLLEMEDRFENYFTNSQEFATDMVGVSTRKLLAYNRLMRTYTRLVRDLTVGREQ
jgi:hypothetical protein